VDQERERFAFLQGRAAMSDGPKGPAPEHNVYTVLVILATAVVASATVFLGVKSQQLFGSWNPFS
jgi:hypothetical protein